MPITPPRQLSLSLTSLPSHNATNQACPVCLECVGPFLTLSCSHVVCVPCGSTADAHGFASCPQCRAPTQLSMNKMMKALDTHRQGYSDWRKGAKRGAKGELSDIRLPPAESGITKFSTTKGLLYHDACGLLSVAKLHSRDQNTKPLETSNVPKTPETVAADRPTPTFMYDALLNLEQSSLLNKNAIVFIWWPRSSMWTKERLCWRSLRALASSRPGLDLLAMPDLPDARASFKVWCELYGLREWQAIWYDPLLTVEEGGEGGDSVIPDLATADRSFMALQTILDELTTHRIPASRRHLYHIFHSHPNAAVRDQIQACGLNFLGDQDEHPILGSLREAKAWLHADYDSSSQRVSLPDAIRNGEITSTSVHIPRGYVCASVEEQYEAFRELKSKDPSIRVVIKPTDGLGSTGVVLDATEADLAPKNTKNWLKGLEYTIEEMIGAKGGPSPTVYMCGSTPIVVADQVMGGTNGSFVNQGNFVPSAAPSAMQQTMRDAGAAIGEYLGLRGQWGLDFVINEATQDPVIVDLNMGRPNGSLSYFLWRSRQVPPPTLTSEDGRPLELHQTVVDRLGPAGETADDFVQLLRKEGMLWLPGRTEGVVPAIFLSGWSGTILCVSWKSRAAVSALITRLREVDPKTTYDWDA